MGNAKRRGTYDERKARAIAAGRIRRSVVSTRGPASSRSLFEYLLRITAPTPKKPKVKKVEADA